MKVTVREVAKAANVSVGTVSRVLNGDRSVNRENIDRVSAVISSLNYRRLRKRRAQGAKPSLRNMNIALVLLGMDRSLVTLPVVAAALHGVEAAVSRGGASLLLADAPRLDESPAVLEQHRIDGVILKGALQGDAIAKSTSPLIARLRRLPSVWLLGRPNGCWGDAVTADDLAAGNMAADHLLARGHRHLAFVSPKPDHVTFRRRELGFVERAREAGVEVQRWVDKNPARWPLPLHPAHDLACVQELIDQLLASRPRPTALFCPADSIAALVYRALSARDLRVGRDISVISANNERPTLAWLHPALTTIDTHAELIGHRAVDQLLWRMGHREQQTAVDVSVAPTLAPGDSVHELVAA